MDYTHKENILTNVTTIARWAIFFYIQVHEKGTPLNYLIILFYIFKLYKYVYVFIYLSLYIIQAICELYWEKKSEV